MKRILIFSGTTEGRELAEWLDSEGIMVHVRVATEYGAVVMEPSRNIDVRVGSCGGAEGIAKVIDELSIGIVVDATHPYALNITRHIREACEKTGAEYIRLRRADSEEDAGDVVRVNSVEEAVEYLKGTDGRILAATGSNELALYTRIPDYTERVVARVLSTVESVQKCAALGFEGRNLICAQGPFSEEMNVAMLKQTGARYMVTKDSGDAGGFSEKVRAAKRAGATLVVIDRPEERGLDFHQVQSRLAEELEFPFSRIEPPTPRLSKRRVSLIGIGMGPGDLTERSASIVSGADLLVGAKRMLEAVDASGKDTLTEYRSDVILRYLDDNPRYRNVAVLLSGDVGFYSGAKGLLERIDRNVYDIDVEPGISSIVYLCAKLGTTWQDAYLTSSHGRDSNIVNLVGTRAKVFTLLSGQDSVHDMCRQLFEYNLNSVSVTVGQDFGYPTESIFTGSPSECLDESFGDLCVALIMNPTPDTRNSISIPDEAFTRGDAPMTKSEVRTLSVAKLKLCRDSVVYDIGAGTGSVSIEMALTAYLGKVYAIEREDIAADLIEINKRKFQAANLEVVRGLAPEAMADLPAPTHAFIGGSAGNLKSIVECLLDKNPDVRIVINSVTIETMAETMQVIRDLGLVEEEIVNVTISKSKRLGRYHLMTGQNPVYIAVVRGR